MLPAIAWMVGAYIIFRCIERCAVCNMNKEMSNISKGIVIVSALICIAVVALMIADITSAGTSVDMPSM